MKFKNYIAVGDRVKDGRKFAQKNSNIVARKQNEVDEEHESDFHSEYENSNGDVNSICSSDEDELHENCNKKVRKKTMYDPICDYKDLKLELGMRFDDGH